MIISGFPGIGKTSFYNAMRRGGVSVLDSDSSNWNKDEFPKNYIEHIKKVESESVHDFILVSSHKEVRDAMIEEQMYFTLVYPDESLKDEYISRYIKRGSPDSFVLLLSQKWKEWIKECDDLSDSRVAKIKLKKGEYLSDVIWCERRFR